MTVQTEGGREAHRPVSLYNLETILAVGHRVHSPRGVQFRRWASMVLKTYLVKGVAKALEQQLGRRTKPKREAIHDQGRAQSAGQGALEYRQPAARCEGPRGLSASILRFPHPLSHEGGEKQARSTSPFGTKGD